MKAKDITIIDYQKILERVREISFKAGRDSFLDDVGNATIPLSEVYKKGEKAGIKEVVEWIKENSFNSESIYALSIWQDAWQAKLKEWGLSDD